MAPARGYSGRSSRALLRGAAAFPASALASGQRARDGTYYVADEGSVADGADATALVNAALARGYRETRAAKGASLRLRNVAPAFSGQRLILDGADVFASAPAVDQHLVQVLNVNDTSGTGSAPLAADTAPLASPHTVSLASGKGALFAAGDPVMVGDTQTLVSPYLYGGNEEPNVVAGVSGDVLTLYYPVTVAATTAAAGFVQKIVGPQEFTLTGGNLRLTGGQAGGLVHVEKCLRFRIEGVRTWGSNDDPGFQYVKCRDFRETDTECYDGQNQGTGGTGYGRGIHNCVNFEIVNPKSRNVRENNLSYLSRYFAVKGADDADNADTAWNTHGAGVHDGSIQGACRNMRNNGYATGYGTDLLGDYRIRWDVEVANAASHGVVVNGHAGVLNSDITVRAHVRGFGSAFAGVYVGFCAKFDVNADVDNLGNSGSEGVRVLAQATEGVVRGRVANINLGYGVRILDSADQVACVGVRAVGISASNFRNEALNGNTPANLQYYACSSDDATNTFLGTEEFYDCRFGGSDVRTRLGQRTDVGALPTSAGASGLAYSNGGVVTKSP